MITTEIERKKMRESKELKELNDWKQNFSNSLQQQFDEFKNSMISNSNNSSSSNINATRASTANERSKEKTRSDKESRKIKTLMVELDGLRAEVKTLRGKEAEMKQAMKAIKKQFQDEKQMLLQEVETLQTKVTAQRDSSFKLDNQLRQEIDDLQSKLHSQQKEHCSTVNLLQWQLEDLRKQVLTSKNQVLPLTLLTPYPSSTNKCSISSPCRPTREIIG